MKTHAKSGISKPKLWTFVLVDTIPFTINDTLAKS